MIIATRAAAALLALTGLTPAGLASPAAASAAPATPPLVTGLTVAASAAPALAGRPSPRRPTVSYLPGPADSGRVAHVANPVATAHDTARTYPVLVRLLNRAGTPLPPPAGPASNNYSFLGTVVNTGTGQAPPSLSYDRAAHAYRVSVPAGRYYLDGVVNTPAYRAALVDPGVEVRGATTITLDASAAVPASARVSHPGAATLLDYAEIDQVIAGQQVASAYATINSPGRLEPFYVTPTAAVTGRPFSFSLHVSLTSPGSFPTARNPVPASYEYNLLFVHHGSVPADLAYQVPGSRLATVQTSYHSERATVPSGDHAQQANLPLGPDGEEAASFDSPVVIEPAGQATLYFAAPPGIRWASNYLLDDVQAGPSDLQPPRAYLAGQGYADSFGKAALGPAGVADRIGGAIDIFPAPFSPSEPGHQLPAASTLSIDGSRVHSTLSLNGKVIGRSAVPYATGFSVPPARGLYTLTQTATRPASDWSVLGTASAVTWSFFSHYQRGPAPLPLLTVRVSGPFGPADAVPAGKAVPLSVQVQGIPYGSSLTRLALSDSVNGGRTWHRIRLYRAGGHWLALVTSPPDGGFVSLRTSAADTAGDSVIATTIRAYAAGQGAGAAR